MMPLPQNMAELREFVNASYRRHPQFSEDMDDSTVLLIVREHRATLSAIAKALGFESTEELKDCAKV